MSVMLGERLKVQVDRLDATAWPNRKYQNRSVAFAREVVGCGTFVDPETGDRQPDLAPWQVEIMNAVDEGDLTAVSSGQKIGKTFLLAIIALAYFSSWTQAKVTLTATTETQVDNVVYDEIRNCIRLAHRNGHNLLAGGTQLAENPRTGIESPDGRSIRGLTVRQIEAMGGISGAHQLFIADEASSLEGKLAEAIAGNTAGGGKQLWTSNPTRSEGPFYDAFHRFKKWWTTFQISSEDTAKWLAANGVKIPGMATIEVIERWAEMWGRDSPFFKVRVLGLFLQLETGKINSLHAISEAQRRWDETSDEGVLSVGIDVAGEAQDGDPWVWCFRRGRKVLEFVEIHGLTEKAGLEETERLLAINRRGDEIPIVKYDAEGRIGATFGALLAQRAAHLAVYGVSKSFQVQGVTAHDDARRMPQMYDKIRDELWACGNAWLRAGGAIPPDHYKLAEELHAPNWVMHINGKNKATPKEGPGGLRKLIGRSTDYADAFNLATWEEGEDLSTQPSPRLAPVAPWEPNEWALPANARQGGTQDDFFDDGAGDGASQSDWAFRED